MTHDTHIDTAEANFSGGRMEERTFVSASVCAPAVCAFTTAAVLPLPDKASEEERGVLSASLSLKETSDNSCSGELAAYFRRHARLSEHIALLQGWLKQGFRK